MSRHVVATVGEIAPGSSKLVTVKGREIGLFNVKGEYFALANKCPHEGAALCRGNLVDSRSPTSPATTGSRAKANCSNARGTVGNSTCGPGSPTAIPTTPLCANTRSRSNPGASS